MKRALDWGVFLLFLVALYMFAGPTALGGPASYVIVSGTSMEPTYDDGDLVVATEHDSYDVGDVLVYDAPVQRRFTVIHRAIKDTPAGYITQGDNRKEPDGWDVAPDTVRGSASVHVPYGGTVVRTLRQPPVMFAVVAGLGVLAFYKRKRGTTGEKPDDDDPAEDDSDQRDHKHHKHRKTSATTGET